MTGARVVVAVCTFRRPELLADCLDSLERQRGREPFGVLVVDNSPEGGARGTVGSRHDARLPVRYLHEPRPGIARARNAAVRAAVGAGAQFLAFVDDDEVVRDGWLDALVAVADGTGADLVSGVTVSRFPDSAPRWLRRSAPFNLQRHPTGTRLTEAATGNLLVRTSVLAGRPESEWFAPALGTSGGSDTDLTRRLAAQGAAILWCDESVVEELVPPERATARWCVRRGARTAGIHVMLRRPTGPGQVLRTAAGGVARVVVGSALTVGSVAAPPLRGRGLWTLGRGLGVLGALTGRVVQEYRR